MIIATSIETKLWNSIIESLVIDGWKVKYKYDNFDAGIDSDFLILEKGSEEILFGWDNWFEGEIKCSENRMKEIETLMKIKFVKGESINLKPEVIELHRKWKDENRWNNSR